jgi:hypothetical protein
MCDTELDNKSNNGKAPNYWSERALHEKTKRELAELDLKLKNVQLVEVDQVGDHLDKIFSAVRQRLLATPSKIAPLVHAEDNSYLNHQWSCVGGAGPTRHLNTSAFSLTSVSVGNDAFFYFVLGLR